MNPNQTEPQNQPATPQPPVQPTIPTPSPATTPTPSPPLVDASNLFQRDKPGTNPFKSNIRSGRRKKIILAIIAVLLVVLVGLGWLFVFYLPNKPQAVWNTGLNRTGSTINKLVVSSTEKDKLEKIKKSELDGSLEVNGSGVNFSGSFSSKYDPNSTDNNLDVAYTPEGGQENKFNAQVMTNAPGGSELPDIYFKVTGLKLLGIDQFFPGLGSYEDKWISVSSDYLKSIIPPEARENFKKDQQNSLSADDAAELARIASSTTQEYVFTSDTNKSVLVQKKFIGTEKINGNATAYHYQVGFNKNNVTEYCKALVTRFTSADAYKKIPGIDPDNVEKDKQSGLKNCEDSKKDVDENYNFDMWIDKKYKLVSKLRFNDEQEKDNYIEVGQTFKGDDVLPIFMNFHSGTQKYDGKLTLEVNTEQSNTKGAFDFVYNGDPSYTVKASFEFKPYEGEINIQKPSNVIPIEEVFKKLGFDPIGTSNGVNSKAKDSKIKSDINTLYAQIEVFFAQNGYYPSLAELNDGSWRSANNMNSLDSSALKGPNGTANALVRTASATQYGYSPSGCDSKGQKCSGFVLTAKLSSGEKFSKSGSNN